MEPAIFLLRTSGKSFTLKTAPWGVSIGLANFLPTVREQSSLKKHPSGMLTAYIICGCHSFLLVDMIRCLKEACAGKCWQIINQWLCALAQQCLVSMTVRSNGQIILKITQETDMVGVKSSWVRQICPGVT